MNEVARMRGRRLRLPLAATGLLVLLAGATPARALDVRGYGIFKTQDYQQTNTSFRLPAGTLQVGRGYFAYLNFEKDVAINTDYAGARGVAGFSKATSFTLASIGPPWLEPMGTTNSQFTLRLHGHETMSYIIQAVTVLPATQWTPIYTNVGTFNFTDPIGAGLGRRFCRAVQSPHGL